MAVVADGAARPAIFLATDANKDGAVTRDEFKGAFDSWFSEWDAAKAGSLTAAQIGEGLGRVIAANAPAPPGRSRMPAAGAATTRASHARPTSTR